MTRHRISKAPFALVAGLAAAWLLAMPVGTQGPGNAQGLQIGLYKDHEVAAGEVLVKLREHARDAAMPDELDVDRDEAVGDGSVRRIHSRSHNVDTLIARLSRSPDVEYVEPNYILYAVQNPTNDPDYGLLWGLEKISVPIAWAGGWAGTRGNVVAVVDTGIDYNHPDLTENAWSASADFNVMVGNTTVSCLTGTHGFNAIKKTCYPLDDNDHGSHVSGTIGAVGNNTRGIVGVNQTASIMGLKFLNRQGSGATSDAVNAIEFAIAAKNAGYANVRVLSNSWGGGAFSQTLLEAIQAANNAGMLFVASAGNSYRDIDKSPSYPASYFVPNVVAVAATGPDDVRAEWSNYGKVTVDLAAPGVDIYSTVRNGRYGYMSGTSMAAPHVSGAAALVLSQCPGLTPANLRKVLVGYADDVPTLDGLVIGGRLNVNAAVRSCETVPSSVPGKYDFSITAAPTLHSVKRGGSVEYTATVTPSVGFEGPVTFSVSDPGYGITTAWVPPETAYSRTLKVTTSQTTRTWTYNLKITGESESGLARSKTVQLSVTR